VKFHLTRHWLANQWLEVTRQFLWLASYSTRPSYVTRLEKIIGDSDSKGLWLWFDKNDSDTSLTVVNPSFIAISETRMKGNIILNINILGFSFAHNLNSRGVGLYINSKLTYQLWNDLNLNNIVCESRFIEIPTSSEKPFIMGVVYHYPKYPFPSFQDEFTLNLSHTFKTIIVIVWLVEISTLSFLRILNSIMQWFTTGGSQPQKGSQRSGCGVANKDNFIYDIIYWRARFFFQLIRDH